MSLLCRRNVLRQTCSCPNITLPILLRRLNHAQANPSSPNTPRLVRTDEKRHATTQSTGAVQGKPGAKLLQKKGKQAKKLTGEKKQQEEASYQDQLKQLEMVSAMEHSAPFDVWAQPVETFDLRIPGWKSKKKGASFMEHLSAFWANQNNWVKNVISMFRMVQENSFPGVKKVSVFSPQLFRVQSTPWLAPFRKTVLEQYQEIQKAVAAGDDKTVKKLAIGDYRSHVLKLSKAAARDPSRVCVWKFHGEKSPCRVVSLRASVANMGNNDPKFGNRLIIQALVRFDTLQSLQVYSKKGGTLLSGDGSPKNVVEYLVFQKRMWQDVPWVVRDQLYEGLEGKFKQIA